MYYQLYLRIITNRSKTMPTKRKDMNVGREGYEVGRERRKDEKWE